MAVKRMHAVTCDRCEAKFMAEHEWMRVQACGYREGSQGTYPKHDLPEKADLCSDCVSEFKVWWGKPKRQSQDG